MHLLQLLLLAAIAVGIWMLVVRTAPKVSHYQRLYPGCDQGTPGCPAGDTCFGNLIDTMFPERRGTCVSTPIGCGPDQPSCGAGKMCYIPYPEETSYGKCY